MPVEIRPPEYQDENLCSISIEVPTQARRSEDFPLLASAWFGTQSKQIQTMDGPRQITYGIQSAKLVVDTCNTSRIANRGRYKRIEYTFTFTEKTNEETDKSGGGGGGVALQTPQSLKWLEAKAKASGEYNKAVSVVREGETERKKHYYSVWDASIKHWCIAALDAQGDKPVLVGNELGDEPLCYIETPQGTAVVTARIMVTFGDLWLDIAASDKKSESREDAANRRAVANLLYAERMEKRSNKADPEQDESEMMMARAQLSVTPDTKS